MPPWIRARSASLVLLPVLMTACAGPQEEPPPAPQDVAAAVAARAVRTEDIAAALDWAGLPPLALGEGPSSSSDPDDPAFWRGAAWAFNPAVRHARGELQAAQAHSDVAGQPEPVSATVESVDPGGDDRDTQVNVLFDLLGLLGIGRPAASRALADAQALAALGRLERAAWAALADVDRALAGVGAAQARLKALEDLLAQAELDVPRLDVLMHSGWVAPTEGGSAVAAVLELQHRIAMARVELAEARARLARVAGLPPDAAALAGVGAAALDRLDPREGDPPRPTPAELVARLPELRALALSCGVAEAQLRRVAASRWPRLALGPRLEFQSDETLVGGVLAIDWAWPGAMDAEMREAEAVRSMARTDLEDGLLTALTRAEERGVRLHEAFIAQRTHLPDIDAAWAARWYTARMRFQTDPQALGEWTSALLDRIATGLAVIDGQEALAVAAVDLREATGLPPRDPPGALAASAEAGRAMSREVHSEVRSDLDLAGLQRPTLRPPPRRRFGLLVALAIVLAFLALLASSARDLLVGATSVTIVRPAPATERAAAGAVLVQAAGWIEPDPFPIDVPALVQGVVRDVLVQESEPVHAGDPVALLVDDDARLALRAAEAGLQRAQAESARAAALAGLEQQRFDAALDVTADTEVARAEETLAQASARAADAAAAGAQAAVGVDEAELALQVKLAQAGGAGLRQVDLAQARLDMSRATHDEKVAQAQSAAAASRVAAARRTRAEGELQLRTADRARLQDAHAAQALAEAGLADALAVRDQAALALERTTVRAPREGVVLARLAAPGAVLDGGAAGAAVVTLYDPLALRVRVDVPQAQVGRLLPGQACEILSESRPGQPYRGELLRVVQRADIQKVTLQAHVRVLDSDGLLRPEMLVQVRFLGAAGVADGASATVLLPARVLEAGGGADAVWVVDALDGRARRREVTVLRRDGDAVELTGLDISARVIDDGRAGLTEGARVAVRASDD